jgi:hypothetical protein
MQFFNCPAAELPLQSDGCVVVYARDVALRLLPDVNGNQLTFFDWSTQKHAHAPGCDLWVGNALMHTVPVVSAFDNSSACAGILPLGAQSFLRYCYACVELTDSAVVLSNNALCSMEPRLRVEAAQDPGVLCVLACALMVFVAEYVAWATNTTYHTAAFVHLVWRVCAQVVLGCLAVACGVSELHAVVCVLWYVTCGVCVFRVPHAWGDAVYSCTVVCSACVFVIMTTYSSAGLLLPMCAVSLLVVFQQSVCLYVLQLYAGACDTGMALLLRFSVLLCCAPVLVSYAWYVYAFMRVLLIEFGVHRSWALFLFFMMSVFFPVLSTAGRRKQKTS